MWSSCLSLAVFHTRESPGGRIPGSSLPSCWGLAVRRWRATAARFQERSTYTFGATEDPHRCCVAFFVVRRLSTLRKLLIGKKHVRICPQYGSMFLPLCRYIPVRTTVVVVMTKEKHTQHRAAPFAITPLPDPTAAVAVVQQ